MRQVVRVLARYPACFAAAQAARNYRRTLRRILLYTAAATAVGGAVYFGYRFFESQQSSAEASVSDQKQPPAVIADQ